MELLNSLYHWIPIFKNIYLLNYYSVFGHIPLRNFEVPKSVYIYRSFTTKDLRTFLRTLLLCVVTSLGWNKGIFGICTLHIIPFLTLWGGTTVWWYSMKILPNYSLNIHVLEYKKLFTFFCHIVLLIHNMVKLKLMNMSYLLVFEQTMLKMLMKMKLDLLWKFE